MGRYQKKIVTEKINIIPENIGEYNINKLTEQAINSIALQIPTKDILNRLSYKGFLRKLPKTNRYKGRGIG